MTIDFHAAANRNTYAGREAQPDWQAAMRAILDPAGRQVVDIGCGGGIYTAAWAGLGAAGVTGIDFSAQMVADATAATAGRGNIRIRQGDACRTGLPDAAFDIVFARALIHHLPDLGAFCREAFRLARPGGVCILQDRRPEDVALPGSTAHIRGYFFECFPRLAAIEAGRRPSRAAVEGAAMRAAGFAALRSEPLWETRRHYPDREALAADLSGRTGRSILHDLSDAELGGLIEHILAQLPAAAPVAEADRWTLWIGRRPG